MQKQISSVAAKLRPYFDGLLREDAETGGLYLHDDELGDRASCCTQGQVASFYVLDEMLHGGDGGRKAFLLAADIRRRQLENGAFTQPYYVKKGESGTVDIAEIGAVANGLYHVARATGSEASRSSLILAADYLLTQVAAEHPGAVYKNPNARGHDVLNGDMYAAHTWGRAYELTGNVEYLRRAEAVFAHLADRFGRHSKGWWPYIERWDGSVGMGNSVSYQGTIIGFAHTAWPHMPAALRRKWADVEREAVDTMLTAMEEGPNDRNEAPWWCRDWNNAWEIYLAFSRFPANAAATARVQRRLREVDERLGTEGAAVFRPNVAAPDPERTPVTTTFRKAATFAGIVSYMILDHMER
jgi:hypothetical protein